MPFAIAAATHGTRFTHPASRFTLQRSSAPTPSRLRLAAGGDDFRENAQHLGASQRSHQAVFFQCINDWDIALFAGEDYWQHLQQSLVGSHTHWRWAHNV